MLISNIPKIQTKSLSGFIALLLLHIIDSNKEPLYGYKIIQELNITTNGKLKLREGTVYPILRYLQTQNFMTSFLSESPNGAPRKYYTITREGKKALNEGLLSWHQLRDALMEIFQTLEV
jgi:PadR family transcriptional regulator PadR